MRLLDGSTLSAVFKAQEPLAAVRVYVQMNGANGQDFNLITPYPRRVYTDLDMEKPLRELGKRICMSLNLTMPKLFKTILMELSISFKKTLGIQGMAFCDLHQ